LIFLFGDAAAVDDDEDALGGDELTFGFDDVWWESESRWWMFLVGDDDRDTLGDGARVEEEEVEEEVVEVVDEAVPFE
jgi:hypothetical protein